MSSEDFSEAAHAVEIIENIVLLKTLKKSLRNLDVLNVKLCFV